jgi:cell division protein FtsL
LHQRERQQEQCRTGRRQQKRRAQWADQRQAQRVQQVSALFSLCEYVCILLVHVHLCLSVSPLILFVAFLVLCAALPLFSPLTCSLSSFLPATRPRAPTAAPCPVGGAAPSPRAPTAAPCPRAQRVQQVSALFSLCEYVCILILHVLFVVRCVYMYCVSKGMLMCWREVWTRLCLSV